MRRWGALGLVIAIPLAIAVTRARAQQQPGWEIRVPERALLAAGATTQVEIAIALDRGLVVSRDAPVIVDLASEGVALKKKRLLRADAVDPGADAPRFSATVKAEAAGEHVVKIRVRLWVCGGKICKPLDVHRQTTVIVEAAPPPDAGVDARN